MVLETNNNKKHIHSEMTVDASTEENGQAADGAERGYSNSDKHFLLTAVGRRGAVRTEI